MGRFVSLVTFCTATVILSTVGCRRSPQWTGNVTVKIAAAVPPARASDIGLTAVADRLTTERLLNLSNNGRPAPGLAETWEWNPARTRLRLKLTEGVRFHDGTALTPQIAAESLRSAFSRESLPSLSSLESIVPSGARTIDVRLKRPDAFLLEDIYSASLRLPGHSDIGNGPFVRLQSPADRILLHAFPRYYRGRPAIDDIEIDFYPTQRNAWAAMLRNQADVLYEVSRDALEFVLAERRVTTYSFLRPYYVWLGFNMRHPALKSAAVRRAINRAIDRDLIVKEGLRGQGLAADGPIWPEHWAYTPPGRPFTYDPEAARRELDGAGFPVRAAAAPGMSKRLSFTCLVYDEDARFERTALLIQKQLYDVGIDMKLEPVRLAEMGRRSMDGQFDAILFEMAGGKFLGFAYTFWHSPVEQKRIDSGYHSADEVLERLRRGTSEESIRHAVADLNDVFSTDPPAVFIAWQSQTRAASRRLTIPDQPNTDILSTGLNLWKIGPAEVAER